jgi:hypothetical protein
MKRHNNYESCQSTASISDGKNETLPKLFKGHQNNNNEISAKCGNLIFNNDLEGNTQNILLSLHSQSRVWDNCKFALMLCGYPVFIALRNYFDTTAKVVLILR